ncbi:MAG: sulfatase [Terriglobales bacterium]
MSRRCLVFITIDCLRADHVGWLGYDRPTTPFLDSIAKDSAVFSNAIVAGAPTYFSFPAIMASRDPLALGREIVGLAPGEPTIASVLKNDGYSTAAFIAANPYLSARFGYDSGFDVFHDFSPDVANQAPTKATPTQLIAGNSTALSEFNRWLERLTHKAKWSSAIYDELYFQYCRRLATPHATLENLRPFPTADVMVQKACAWLADKADRPFFLWLHFMDAHSPYYPSEPAWRAMGHRSPDADRMRYLNAYWNRLDLSAERLRKHRGEIVELYDAGIRWVDAQLESLAKTLRQLGAWERTVFAVTADHGEEFLEHGGRYHSPAQLGEEIIRVPLLIRDGGAPKRASEEGPFSLLHLAPTLLDALGMAATESFRGRSVWSRLGDGKELDEATITEVVPECTNPLLRKERLSPRALVVRERNYKMVLDFGTARIQLFDLRQDPGERNPLPPNTGKPVQKRLLEKALRHITQSQRERDSQMALMARLRELRLECA